MVGVLLLQSPSRSEVGHTYGVVFMYTTIIAIIYHFLLSYTGVALIMDQTCNRTIKRLSPCAFLKCICYSDLYYFEVTNVIK